MGTCPHCGALTNEGQKICIECGKKLVEKHKREGLFGYLIFGAIGILIPIIGLIIARIIRDTKPHTSRFVLILSIISLILWIALFILLADIFIGILVGIFDSFNASIIIGFLT